MGINKYMYRVCMGVNDFTVFCKLKAVIRRSCLLTRDSNLRYQYTPKSTILQNFSN